MSLERCTKAILPSLLTWLAGLGLDCAEQQSCYQPVHPLDLQPLPILRYPCARHTSPGHTAQHATDKRWDGLQLSLPAANPTKHREQ